MLLHKSAAFTIATTSALVLAGCAGSSLSQGPAEARIVAASTTTGQVHTVTADRQSEPADRAERSLGAGDSLGRAVFQQYAQRIKQHNPPQAKDDRASPASQGLTDGSKPAAEQTTPAPGAIDAPLARDTPTPRPSAGGDPVMQFLQRVKARRDLQPELRPLPEVARRGR